MFPFTRAQTALGTFLLGIASASVFGQTRVIEWGTTLEPSAQVAAAKALAKSIANPSASNWRAKGDQKRSYRFPDANATIPYRLCVPNNWDGKSRLSLVMFLHGSGNDESSYLDANNKLMVRTADQHGVLLVSAMGHQSAYGTFLRLPAVFGKPEEVAPMLAKRTDATEKANELSERDVLNVLELVKAEYPIDTTNMFLTGHSMGSGGTWYIGGKYPDYWRGLAPMSGPFVTETGYPWGRMLKMPIFVTEGTLSATLQSSRVLCDWMLKNDALVKYEEVVADHGGMIAPVVPHIYDWFDSLRRTSSGVRPRAVSQSEHESFVISNVSGSPLRIAIPGNFDQESVRLSLIDPSGKVRFARSVPVARGEAMVEAALPMGIYQVRIER